MIIFFEIWHWSWALLGCYLNLLLTYLAIFRSPKAIKSYATLIINFAATDFVECALDLFIQTRLVAVPGEAKLVYIFNGPCKYTGSLSCKVGLSFLLHCLTHSVWSLLISFGYRFYILHNPALSRLTLLKITIMFYIPSLVQALTYWTLFVPREKILPLAKQWFPYYDLETETGVLTGVIDLTNFVAVYAVAHICLPFFPVYITIFVLRQKIMKYLGGQSQMMSQDTKAAHTQLLRALTTQAIIPMFLGIAVLLYFSSQSGLLKSPILEYSIFSVAILMPALSPITYLYFVRPYRQKVKRIIRHPFKLLSRPHERATSNSGVFYSGDHPTHFSKPVIAVH
ncbi:Serpentine receptor class delta-19 [Caenorhabditis elegans]|uniref:Serpentine receptor class delta-19 n=1 Tax=Caenorhabditis elegans TaxID=6239 RepID=SRD19_CAEEL|nr:Serpentine receptor class delta-19 [Caenorhabditis elegans]P92002.1 RecName: Full=Serpentine receptor class delta-19; Short=Protein srd-19 [Caenorhabditis elegans]CAB03132.1 Serpentine receptor class delta-19 [Caenorhabditis elegans]|eukprot:NP_506331.1 Serpentine receptor class delta-19 [Caenorhabditis elegans]